MTADPIPRITVVAPTRNRRDRLIALLDALAQQDCGVGAFEVVVVDDGSSDGSAVAAEEYAESSPLEIRIEEGAGSGPAAARNLGWRAARGELVAFTDDDCEPAAAWLSEVLSETAAHPGALVQGRTLPIERELEHAGPLARTKRIEAGPGPWFQTCNMVYPRELLERLGGFDESFRGPFGEDAELAWRALESGAEARFAERALVFHAVEPRTGLEYVLSGLRDPDEAAAFKLRDGLRREVAVGGIFKSESHAYLAAALAGLVLSHRSRANLILVLPYAKLLAARSRAEGGGSTVPACLVGFDVLETASAVRGALRHRVPLF